MTTKFCTKCRRERPKIKFRIHNGYYESWCMACEYKSRKAYHARYREKTKQERLSKYKEWRRENYAKYTLMILKKRARDRGIPFDLSESDLALPETCPVLGMPLRNNRGKAADNSPSVDRIVPQKGYTRGNVRIISHRANVLKNNASIKEMEAILNYMKFPRA